MGEKFLGAPQSQLATIVADSTDAILCKDLQGIITFWNRGAEQIYGYTSEEMIGQPVSKLLPPDRPDEVLSILRKIAKGQRVPHFETMRQRKDGRQIFVSLAVSPMTDGKGRVIGASAVARDVTARREAEQRQRESEQKFAALVDASAQIVWTTNAAGEVTEDSPSWRAFTGQTTAQWRGTGWLDAIHPDDRQRIMARWLRAVEEKKPVDLEYRLRHHTGEWRVTTVRAVPLRNPASEVTGWVGMNVDITERRLAEQALRDSEARMASFLDNSHTIGWMKDRLGRYVYVSSNLDRRFGCDPGAWLGKTDRELWPAEVAGPIMANDRAVLEQDCPLEVEEEVHESDGKHSWWLCNKFPFRDEAGNLFIGGLGIDITDRKRGEQELKKARIAAEVANRAKSQFLANVSHEIRTPMTAILGYADILTTHLTNPDNRLCVQTIRRHGEYLCEILNDILDLSKMEAGKLAVHRQACNVVGVLRDVYSMMSVRAEERGIELNIEFPEAIPLTIETDRIRLRQVLVNLIGNAIKFTQEGSVRVVVRRQLPDRLQFQIIDTGIGIEPEVKNRLFHPFEQVDSSMTRTAGGTGLGLVISKRLVEMLGGGIQVESAVGHGSTFTFSVSTGPVDEAAVQVPNLDVARPLSRNDGDGRTPQLTGRILVVDDRREVRHVAQHMIESAGGQVVMVENGQQAVDWIRHKQQAEQRQPIDVVLMDMQMPVLDGYQATETLRATGFAQPIIALTAHAMVGDREKCLRAGCDDYLAKPLDQHKLIRMLAQYTQPTKQDGNPMPEPPEQPKPQAAKVLIVDDNESICRMQELLLGQLGHTASLATSGADAIAAALENPPDVILLDMGLGDMSGGEALAQLKPHDQLRGCLFLCQSGRSEDEVDWRGLGFDHYFQKPADMAVVDRVIRSHLAARDAAGS